MGPAQSNRCEMKVEADSWRSTTSARLRGRARHYRLAAALADGRGDEAMFCDLAMMFDQLAHDFRRFENERRRMMAARHERTQHRPPDGRLNWAEKANVGLTWIRSLARRAAANDGGRNVVSRRSR